ncbi:hypothetical protein BDV96DRAFT_598791 [Lophiotrema nucula]|uniref:Heterokaryon incompatibility domain-containing protein n=1 Tax=Lophiotrema nucula TaxID=690887 RepID=A0A6A5ZDH3_9PLEO|nr:hypothetical protein BDV96DRAFT_598791 [Lophiotrema nucula]
MADVDRRRSSSGGRLSGCESRSYLEERLDGCDADRRLSHSRSLTCWWTILSDDEGGVAWWDCDEECGGREGRRVKQQPAHITTCSVWGIFANRRCERARSAAGIFFLMMAVCSPTASYSSQWADQSVGCSPASHTWLSTGPSTTSTMEPQQPRLLRQTDRPVAAEKLTRLQPLKDPTKQFRLLRFASDSSLATIRCDIVVRSVADSVGSYSAISYTWGDPKRDSSIIIKEHGQQSREVLVGRNLGLALRDLHTEEPFERSQTEILESLRKAKDLKTTLKL